MRQITELPKYTGILERAEYIYWNMLHWRKEYALILTREEKYVFLLN